MKHRGMRKIFACKKCRYTTNNCTNAVKHVRKCLAKAKQSEAKEKKARVPLQSSNFATVGFDMQDFETALDEEVLERSEEAVESGRDTTVRSTQEQSPTHSGEDSSDFELYFSDSSFFSESDEE